MKLRFSCTKCGKSAWDITYLTEEKYHRIMCVACGDMTVLESVFGNRKISNSIQKREPDVMDTKPKVNGVTNETK